jgi:acyl carrier protein
MTDQVLEQVKRILIEDLDVNLRYEDLDETVPLFEDGLALDSVLAVELIGHIETRFSIVLPDNALNLDTFHNLQSVARVVGEQLALQRKM